MRLRAPSLRSNDDTWLSTVRSDTCSRAAISELVQPLRQGVEHLGLTPGDTRSADDVPGGLVHVASVADHVAESIRARYGSRHRISSVDTKSPWSVPIT